MPALLLAVIRLYVHSGPYTSTAIRTRGLGKNGVVASLHSSATQWRHRFHLDINLDVDDCRSLEAHLEDMGLTWVRKVEQMPFGLVGTVDGNTGAPNCSGDVRAVDA